MTWLFLSFIKCVISNYLLFHFQLVAKNSLEINALSCEYGAGWEVWVPLMRNGGCLCHPTPAEQQRLDRQHQHDGDHPDPTTIFYTQDQLLQLRASDRREPTRADKQRFLTPGHQGRNDLHSLCRIGMEYYLLNNDDNNIIYWIMTMPRDVSS